MPVPMKNHLHKDAEGPRFEAFFGSIVAVIYHQQFPQHASHVTSAATAPNPIQHDTVFPNTDRKLSPLKLRKSLYFSFKLLGCVEQCMDPCWTNSIMDFAPPVSNIWWHKIGINLIADLAWELPEGTQLLSLTLPGKIPNWKEHPAGRRANIAYSVDIKFYRSVRLGIPDSKGC